MFYRALALLAALSGVAPAQPPRAAVEAVYRKCDQAAAYRFYPTMVAYRGADYQSFSPDGGRLDLSNEPERYAALFQTAIEVRLQTSLESFEAIDPNHCRCRIRQQLRVSRPQKDRKTLITMTLVTQSLDQWQKGALGWRVQRREISYQGYDEPEVTR